MAPRRGKPLAVALLLRSSLKKENPGQNMRSALEKTSPKKLTIKKILLDLIFNRKGGNDQKTAY